MAYEILPPLAGTPSNLLTNSRWKFDRYVMDGVELADNLHGEWIEFEEITWIGFDGCNRVGGGFKTNEEGDFLANLGYSTLVLCPDIYAINEEDQSVEEAEFIKALERVVEFEIQDEYLWLFYPEDERNALVFSPEGIIED